MKRSRSGAESIPADLGAAGGPESAAARARTGLSLLHVESGSLKGVLVGGQVTAITIAPAVMAASRAWRN